MKKFYISTPIYYPSGKPHIGHAYTTVLADVITRYKKILGYETFFLTGTDEHGKKIEEKALAANLNINDYLEQNVQVFKDLWNNLGIKCDKFIRTTDKEHIKTVQEVFSIYLAKNLIYLDQWKGTYCVACEETLTSKELIKKDGKLYCGIGHEIISISEESYFFKMSNFNDWILDYFKTNKDLVFPHSRMNELSKNFLNDKLKDLSISRTSFNWGITIRENPKHIIYVWMDALFSYLTALNFLNENDALFQKFWNDPKTERVHLLSKEITRFHCLYWPIFLNALNLNLPTKILSHSWIITNEGKMSKSLGNVVDPVHLIKKYGRDTLRYYLIRGMSLSNDNVFSEEALIALFNGDLANNLGNLVSRTIGMVTKYNSGKIIDFKILNNIFDSLIIKINELSEKGELFINNFEISQFINEIHLVINDANKLIEMLKPWELSKLENKTDLNNLLYVLLKLIQVASFWISPILIDGVLEIEKQTKLKITKASLDEIRNFSFLGTEKIGLSVPIYLRIK